MKCIDLAINELAEQMGGTPLYLAHAGEGDKRWTLWMLPSGEEIIGTNAEPVGEDMFGFVEMRDEIERASAILLYRVEDVAGARRDSDGFVVSEGNYIHVRAFNEAHAKAIAELVARGGHWNTDALEVHEYSGLDATAGAAEFGDDLGRLIIGKWLLPSEPMFAEEVA